jgi:adenylate kinase family enzyme
MRRVAVLGSGGSGKTWLAERIGERLDLPVHELDLLSFAANRSPIPASEFERRQRELVEGERWVIDGNHLPTAPIRLRAADTVVYLDRSTTACLRGLAIRRLSGRRSTAGRVPPVTPRFLWYVATFRRRRRDGMIRLLATERTGVLVVLRSAREMRAFLASLGQPVGRR